MQLHQAIVPILLASAGTADALPEEISTIVVTASRSAETIDETLSDVTVIRRHDIEWLQARSVEDLLRGVAGVQVSTSGGPGKDSSVHIRGSNADQVLVLVDGVKVGSATLGTTAFENLPLHEIERIEIVRGPRSSLYGSEAVGGVIQIFTRRGAGEVTPSAAFGGGSFGTRWVGAGIQGGDDDFSFSLSTSLADVDGYDVRDAEPAEPDNDGYKNRSVSIRVAGRVGRNIDAELTFLGSAGDTEFDGTFVNESNLLQEIVGLRLSAEPFGFWRTQLRLGRSTDEVESLHDGLRRSRFDTRRDTLSWLNDLSVGDAADLLFGLDVHRDEVAGTTSFTARERRNIGLFAQLSGSPGPFDLQLSVRGDDDDQFGSVTTGAAAAAWSLTERVRLRASWGTAFKAPTFNQLYFPGFGNPGLDPERSHSAEFGLRADTGFGIFQASIYRSSIRDLIVFDPVTFFPENIARARITGMSLGYSMTRGPWEVDASLDMLQPENRADGPDRGNLLPRRSDRTLAVDVARGFEKLRAGVRLVAEGHRYDDLANETRIGGHATLDVFGEYPLRPGWRIQLRLDNLLNREYQTAASFDQPERSVFVTLRYQPSTNQEHQQ